MNTIYHHIRKAALLAIAGMAMAGCADYVDIRPKDLVTDDNFWDEKKDVEQMVAGVYTAMQSSDFISRCIVWGESRSDNLYMGLNTVNNNNLYNIERENLLSTNAYCDWTSFYSVINQCNIIIERAPEVAAKDPAYTDLKATIAEMKAIRSLCYFYLIRAFKEVPFSRVAVYEEDKVSYPTPQPFEQVLAEIIADCEEAEKDAILRYPDDANSNYNSSCNRITKKAIRAMLADMYLWSGDYDKAVTMCQKVIDEKIEEFEEDYSGKSSGRNRNNNNQMSSTNQAIKLMKHASDPGVGYPLYSDQEQGGTTWGAAATAIFGEGNSFESIFELGFNASSNTKHLANSACGSLYGAHSSAGGTSEGKGLLAPPDQFVTDISASNRTYWLNTADSRYWTSIVPNNDYTSGFVSKFVDNSWTIERQSSNGVNYTTNGNQSGRGNHPDLDRNWIFYRLTDVMLMQAEAYCMMTSGHDTATADRELFQKAFYLVYPIEARSYMGQNTTSDLPRMNSYLNRAGMEALILGARERELMFEGKRWFDLVRTARREGNTGTLRTFVSPKFTAGTSSSSSNLFSNMESLYWPYYKNELKRNPNLKQKEFYAGADDEDNYKNTAK